MVDTNSDPREVDFVIPANDDATKSIDKIMTLVVDAVQGGLQERKNEKEAQEQAQTEGAAETDNIEATTKIKVEETHSVEISKEEAPATETLEPSDEAAADSEKE